MTIKEKFQNLNKEFFDFREYNGKGLGYEKEKPIMVKSIFQMYNIIKTLKIKKLKDKPNYVCEYNRLGTENIEDFKGPVDCFEVLFEVLDKGKAYFELHELYFCTYPEKNKADYTQIESIISLGMGDEVKLPKNLK